MLRKPEDGRHRNDIYVCIADSITRIFFPMRAGGCTVHMPKPVHDKPSTADLRHQSTVY
jgi:hypothetical protein